MAIRKNVTEREYRPGETSPDRLTERNSEETRINDEDELDTREVSHSIEEGDEDYDDEELADELDLDEEDLEDEDRDEKVI